MTRRLSVTRAIENQAGRVRRAAALYPNRDDDRRPLELEELRLARLVLEALERADFKRHSLETVRPRPAKATLRDRRRRRNG